MNNRSRTTPSALAQDRQTMAVQTRVSDAVEKAATARPGLRPIREPNAPWRIVGWMEGR